MTYPRFQEPLDPDAPLGKPYTFRIAVSPGDSVVSAPVVEVDSSSLSVPAVSLVTISQQTIHLISPGLYGSTFRVQGNGLSGVAYVRCRYATARGVDDDVTYQLVLDQR